MDEDIVMPKYPVEQAIRKTKFKEDNYMILAVGDTGSGKSSLGLTTAMAIEHYLDYMFDDFNKGFDATRVFFKPLPFMKRLEGGMDRGSVMMFDEAGEIVDSREWWSDPNKVITSTVDTFRDNGLILVWCTPSADRLDSRVRDMFDLIIACLKPGKGQMKEVKVNYFSGQKFYSYPKTITKKGKKLKLVNARSNKYYNLEYSRPDKVADRLGYNNLWDAYMEKKRNFYKQDVYAEGVQTLQGGDGELSKDDIAKELVNNPMDFDLNDEDLSFTKKKSIANMILSDKYPEKDFKKGDVKDAITFALKKPKMAEKMYGGTEEKDEDDGGTRIMCTGCGHIWTYNGNKDNTQCSHCNTQLSIQECSLE